METVEATHEKLVKKFAAIGQIVAQMKATHAVKLCMELADAAAKIQAEYYSASSSILTRYYSGEDNNVVSATYRAIVDGRGISNKIDAFIIKIAAAVDINKDPDVAADYRVIVTNNKKRKVKMNTTDETLFRLVEVVEQIQIFGRKSAASNKCACGGEYEVLPSTSQKKCGVCGLIEDIHGIIFKTEFTSIETTRTKNTSYDTSRHYKIWIERLQAIEKKTFEAATIRALQTIMRKHKYTTADLTCEKMRDVIKWAKLSRNESLNEHVPLLIKTFGGPAPPILTPSEDKLLQVRFSKVMLLYTLVNPNARNKPYYPYFIWQLVAEMFKHVPSKLRLLDYIHLQSAETIRKNNEHYQAICALADPGDGIVYHYVGHRKWY